MRDLVALPVLFFVAIASRVSHRRIDVGIGPLPLINNVFHRRAISAAGFTSETFVTEVWYITDQFDQRLDRTLLGRTRPLRLAFLGIYAFAFVVFRYRSVLVYFDGGPLGLGTSFLWRIEPHLFRLAGVKTVVLPYGSDVQVMSRSPNLNFKHAVSRDYPNHRKRHARIRSMIDVWTSYGSHVVSGCEWVDYMHHWDTLLVAHFCIDDPIQKAPISASQARGSAGTFKILHAPNHRAIKGTPHVIAAVEDLRREGYNIELTLAERLPNSEVVRLISECDLVIDQLVIGWYAMFAIEAMSLGKPVICCLRDDLVDLYSSAGLILGREEIPVIHATLLSVKAVIRSLIDDRTMLDAAALAGPSYVTRHHSVSYMSGVFQKIFRSVLRT